MNILSGATVPLVTFDTTTLAGGMLGCALRVAKGNISNSVRAEETHITGLFKTVYLYIR